MEEESTPPPKMEPTAEEAKKKVRQGVWGDTTATVLPEAYELLEEDPEADSTPGRLDPHPTNEELVDKAKASDEVSLIKNSVEFCSYRGQKLDLEAKSPIKLLRLQRHGGPHDGFYHDNCRDDPVVAFKLWHMCYRTQNADFPAQHPYEKYRANETQVFQFIAKTDPVYMGRVSKNDIVFRAGDLRSTYDEDLLEKSSDAGLRVERAHKKRSTRRSFLKEELVSSSKTLCCTTSSPVRSQQKRPETSPSRTRRHTARATSTLCKTALRYTLRRRPVHSHRGPGQLYPGSQKDCASRINTVCRPHG